jgi:hypothetical protein
MVVHATKVPISFRGSFEVVVEGPQAPKAPARQLPSPTGNIPPPLVSLHVLFCRSAFLSGFRVGAMHFLLAAESRCGEDLSSHKNLAPRKMLIGR